MQIAPLSFCTAHTGTHPLPDYFSATMQNMGGFEPQPHLAIAVSGGADSMALCLLAHHWATTQKGRVTALIVEHGLRPESADEAARVQHWLAARQIHAVILPVQVNRQKNLQQAARDARYTALTDYCQQHHILHLLLAHHAGDLAETAALHQARGTTTDGASAMPVCAVRGNTRLLRPLLGCEKTQLIQWLQAQNQPWVEDPSNQNPRFARVRMRQAWQQDRPQLQKWLQNAVQAGHLRHMREQQLAEDAADCVQLYPEGYATLALASFYKLPEARASLLLANIFRTLSGDASRPRAHETKRLYQRIMHQTAAWKATLKGFAIFVDHASNYAIFTREPLRMAQEAITSPTGALHYDYRFQIRWENLPETALPLKLRPLLQEGASYMRKHAPNMLPEYLPKPVQITLPSFWTGGIPVIIPHIVYAKGALTEKTHTTIALTTAKPLADGAFWCLNACQY